MSSSPDLTFGLLSELRVGGELVALVLASESARRCVVVVAPHPAFDRVPVYRAVAEADARRDAHCDDPPFTDRWMRRTLAWVMRGAVFGDAQVSEPEPLGVVGDLEAAARTLFRERGGRPERSGVMATPERGCRPDHMHL